MLLPQKNNPSTMPYTGNQHCDGRRNCRLRKGRLPHAPEHRRVQIGRNEIGQADVPTLPELADCRGAIRHIEVANERQAENAGTTECHVGIPAEIEVHLERPGESRDPRLECRQVPDTLVSSVSELLEGVSEHDLLDKTEGDEGSRGRHPILTADSRTEILNLRKEQSTPEKWTSGDVWKERYECRMLQPSSRFDQLFVAINEIHHLGQSEKAQPKRKSETRDFDPAPGMYEYELLGRAEVLENAQHADVHRNSDQQQPLPACLLPLSVTQPSPDQPVDADRGDEKDEAGHAVKRIEGQRRQQQRDLCGRLTEVIP